MTEESPTSPSLENLLTEDRRFAPDPEFAAHANAHPELLGRGYPVVPANSESGVGRTIQQWLSGDRGR